MLCAGVAQADDQTHHQLPIDGATYFFAGPFAGAAAAALPAAGAAPAAGAPAAGAAAPAAGVAAAAAAAASISALRPDGAPMVTTVKSRSLMVGVAPCGSATLPIWMLPPISRPDTSTSIAC